MLSGSGCWSVSLEMESDRDEGVLKVVVNDQFQTTVNFSEFLRRMIVFWMIASMIASME